jgi:hypothetical protein
MEVSGVDEVQDGRNVVSSTSGLIKGKAGTEYQAVSIFLTIPIHAPSHINPHISNAACISITVEEILLR